MLTAWGKVIVKQDYTETDKSARPIIVGFKTDRPMSFCILITLKKSATHLYIYICVCIQHFAITSGQYKYTQMNITKTILYLIIITITQYLRNISSSSPSTLHAIRTASPCLEKDIDTLKQDLTKWDMPLNPNLNIYPISPRDITSVFTQLNAWKWFIRR